VDLTNTDFQVNGDVVFPRDKLHVLRQCVLWHDVCYQRLHIRNYSNRPLNISLRLLFEADFVDVFEVRGLKRERRGKRTDPIVTENSVQIGYQGLDGRLRSTHLELSPPPCELSASHALLDVEIPPLGEKTHCVAIACQIDDRSPPRLSFDDAAARLDEEFRAKQASVADLFTSNDEFNHWINRSRADLQMMITRTPHGLYPHAGIPWFSAVFGRDGCITALEYLPLNPELAKGVLNCLAATQAREVSPEQDAEPGKILHEMRSGEMAACGEICFGQYYGSADATPLFILLAGAYYERTDDRELIERLWPHLERALDWMERYGDSDGDGFIEYECRSPKGLVTQGWKDSFDSVFHSDGSLAEGPTALCEVQAYMYAAQRHGARLARLLGHEERSIDLEVRAQRLSQRFDEAFWCDELGLYGIALDGAKRLCRVRTSNAGHCLFAGIARPERAVRTAATLMDSTFFSGWGIRTVASTEARYNPMSYHNGSIWPHDNAIIAFGMAQYGLKQHALRLLNALFEASKFVDLRRMPELLCGFVRSPGQGPTPYPVACTPQSWSAAAVFLLLQACLGLSIDAPHSQIRFHSPVLPSYLESLTIRNLHVGQNTVDLVFRQHNGDVGVNLLRREGDVEIMILK
jgi:glycogen debranching enzyme